MGYRNKSELRSGAIRLYQRDAEGGKYQSDNWYVTFKIPGGGRTKGQSLKTKDFEEAKRLANEKYEDVYNRSKRGLSLGSHEFRKVAREYLDILSREAEQYNSIPPEKRRGLHLATPNKYEKSKFGIETFIIPFFGVRYIQDLTEQDIEDYKTYRKSYWITGKGAESDTVTYKRNGRRVTRPRSANERRTPDYNTVNKELTMIRAIIDLAIRKRLIARGEAPHIKNVPKPSEHDDLNKFPEFSQAEMKRLYGAMSRGFFAQTNPKHKPAQKLQILLVALLENTGMRVAEMKNLRFCDCKPHDDDANHLVLNIRGKGKRRESVANSRSVKFLVDKIRVHHELMAKQNGWTVNDETYLQTNQYGIRIKDLNGTFKRHLKKHKLLLASDGRERCLSSLRPTYVTKALLKLKCTYTVARMVGNSPAVIERHYDRIKASQLVEEMQFDSYIDSLVA